jgi:hypothetical protein
MIRAPKPRLRAASAKSAAKIPNVSGAGWISFDPTNRDVGGFHLIPVGVARDIRQVMPVVGSFVGASDAFQAMSVEVAVTKDASTNPNEVSQTGNIVEYVFSTPIRRNPGRLTSLRLRPKQGIIIMRALVALIAIVYFVGVRVVLAHSSGRVE